MLFRSAGASCVVPGGSSPDDTFAPYSNFGPEVDLIAPGSCIVSTDRFSAGGSAVLNGTSMATPHVTGAAARYLHAHPGAGPDEIRQRLIRSAGYDWKVASDPDDDPADIDRLVDVTSLLAGSPGLRLFALPGRASISPAVDAELAVGLQRIGGYAGDVTITRTDGEPAVDTFLPLPGTLDGDAGGTGSVVGRLVVGVGPSTPDGDLTISIRGTGAASGPTADATLHLEVDATPPTVGSPWPFAVLREGVLRDRVPVRIAYTLDDALSGVDRVTIQRSTGGGGWTSASATRVTTSSAEVSLETGTTTGLRVRVTDGAGNVGLSTPLSARIRLLESDRKSTRLNSSHTDISRMPSSA